VRKADLKARIKKIEIVNRVLSDDWAQSIRVILEDIDLTNENLLELKQFRPNETVTVTIEPLQVSFADLHGKQEILEMDQELETSGQMSCFVEGGVAGGDVLKEWKF
jgi:hypothetical protein